MRSTQDHRVDCAVSQGIAEFGGERQSTLAGQVPAAGSISMIHPQSAAFRKNARERFAPPAQATMATPIVEESACSDRRSGIDFRVQEARRATALHRCYDAARDRGDARAAYLPGRAAIVGS